MPPALATPSIPTRPLTTAHRKQKLILAQITRLFFLHDLSLLTTQNAKALFSVDRMAAFLAREREAMGPRPEQPFLARLYRPKVLAVPDRLSVDEYTALSRYFSLVRGPDTRDNRDRQARYKGLVNAWQAMVAAAEQIEEEDQARAAGRSR